MNSLRNNFATLEMRVILAGCGCEAFFFSSVEFELFYLFHGYLRMVTGENKASSCFVCTMTLNPAVIFLWKMQRGVAWTAQENQSTAITLTVQSIFTSEW